MKNIENLNNEEAINKLKNLVDDIITCLFNTSLDKDDVSNCRPMTAIKVCDQGNIWFFSEKGSHTNKDISINKRVQLFFAHPGKNSYLVVNGEAEIILDQTKIEELWTPVAKIWFKEGKKDPSISILKVTPTASYYWDVDGNRMINFLKIAASVATGTKLVTGNEGVLKV